MKQPTYKERPQAGFLFPKRKINLGFTKTNPMKRFRQYSWWLLFLLIITLYLVKFGTKFFDEPSRTPKKQPATEIANSKE
jgi:hypothetical protein